VEADQSALRRRQDELEAHLLAAPAADWREAADKARYLLNCFAATMTSQDPRRQKLTAAVLHHQFLPEKRLGALMADLSGVRLATATIAAMGRIAPCGSRVSPPPSTIASRRRR
jgi:hypothetical protein